MRRGFAFAGLIGIALASAPAAQAGSLKGEIGLGFTGGQVHGYRVSLGGEVGTPGESLDVLSLDLSKTTGGLTQTHAWGVKLVAGEITLNRSKASIVVNDPLGAGGVDGVFDFTFSGRPHLKSLKRLFRCGIKHNVIYGTLTGTIRIKVGDHFFKTITVRRMTGWAADTYTTGCLAPCPRPYDLVQGSGPFSPTKPNVVLTAQTQAGRQLASVAVSVFDPTAGTPFLEISHVLYAVAAKPLVSSNPSLTSANVSTPGGALSGSLGFKSSGALHNLSPAVCKSGHLQETTRSAKVTKGRITATFDSIGKFSLDTNLNASGGLPGLTSLSRVS
jgi:hypothetical protein